MPDLDVLYDSSEVVYYNNPKVPLYIVKSDLTHFPDKCASCHWHDDIEIMYIVDGHLSYNVNGETIDLDTKDAIIVNSKQLHYGFSKDNTDCTYYCYVFKPELLFNNAYLYESYIEPVVSSQNVPFYVLRNDDSAHKELLSLLPGLYSLAEENANGFELAALSRLQLIWNCWYKLLLPKLNGTIEFADADIRVQKAMIVFIQDNFEKKLSIRDIAAAGNISRTKCCQLFKRYYHSSPISYLNSYRLETSIQLLMKSDLSITEIALSCGFNSSSYYAEFFSRTKGCTPTEYRKKYSRV